MQWPQRSNNFLAFLLVISLLFIVDIHILHKNFPYGRKFLLIVYMHILHKNFPYGHKCAFIVDTWLMHLYNAISLLIMMVYRSSPRAEFCRTLNRTRVLARLAQLISPSLSSHSRTNEAIVRADLIDKDVEVAE